MTPDRVEEIYNELGTLTVELDADPSSRGPLYLQDLISRTRGYLNRVSLILHEVHRERHLMERALDGRETAFQASCDELLAEDRRVTQLPNIDDRKAMINVLLRDDRASIANLKREIKELGFVEKAVKQRHRDLESTVSNIRMQKSLIDSETRTGSYYGDETDTSRGSVYSPTSNAIEEAELDELLNKAAEELKGGSPESVPQPVGETPDEEPKNDFTEDSEIEAFLEGDEYSALFKNL